MPGQMNAKIPNSRAKTPRSTIQYQARAKFASIGPTAIFPSFVPRLFTRIECGVFGVDERIGQLSPLTHLPILPLPLESPPLSNPPST
jgi:hypothetical protein